MMVEARVGAKEISAVWMLSEVLGFQLIPVTEF